ncbi:hypothetical protein [Jiulongibacter sediminis]|jgi:hypothetical protein|uniref:hypothetical protein n=1 Tax=Jiulongibacter sediminis TaxID=1605367 RepID=UPI0026F0464E|nr:hypothetical protein [Jiulongibacter sediminis]
MPKLLLFLLLLASCQGNRNNTAQDKSAQTEALAQIEIQSPKDFILDAFTVEGFPKEIDGCACYYWLPDQSEKFIYVDDYARTAFVKIKGHFEEMEIYDVYADGDVIQQKCRGEHWGLTVDLKKVSQMDETTQYAGTLKIDGIDGTTQTLGIKGECGC